MVPHKPRNLGGTLEHRRDAPSFWPFFVGRRKYLFRALVCFWQTPPRAGIVENKKDGKFQQVGFWLKQRSPNLKTTGSQVFFQKKTHWTDILLAGGVPVSDPQSSWKLLGFTRSRSFNICEWWPASIRQNWIGWESETTKSRKLHSLEGLERIGLFWMSPSIWYKVGGPLRIQF